jgi:hypothetical protein
MEGTAPHKVHRGYFVIRVEYEQYDGRAQYHRKYFRWVDCLGDTSEGVIEDNVLTNAGQGILISAFGPYGGPAAYGPVMNTDVLRNTIALGGGNLIAYDNGNYLWGIGILEFPGCRLR